MRIQHTYARIGTAITSSITFLDIIGDIGNVFTDLEKMSRLRGISERVTNWRNHGWEGIEIRLKNFIADIITE